jgi:hypothetical protein
MERLLEAFFPREISSFQELALRELVGDMQVSRIQELKEYIEETWNSVWNDVPLVAQQNEESAKLHWFSFSFAVILDGFAEGKRCISGESSWKFHPALNPTDLGNDASVSEAQQIFALVREENVPGVIKAMGALPASQGRVGSRRSPPLPPEQLFFARISSRV